MEDHDSKLQFEEDKPKESKLTYDSDLAKQAAGKAEHASRLQFDEEEMSEEPKSHAGRKAGKEPSAEQKTEKKAGHPEETEERDSQKKRRKNRLGSGSGSGQERKEAGPSEKLQFEEEEKAKGEPEDRKKSTGKAARRRSGQTGQASESRQITRAGRGYAARNATNEVRKEIRQSDEDENAGVEGAVEGESLAEGSVYAVRDFSRMHKVSTYGYANKLTIDPGATEESRQQTNGSRQEKGGTSAAHRAQQENIRREYAAAKGGYASAGAVGAAAGTATGSATAGQAQEAVKDTAKATEKAAEETGSVMESIVDFVRNHAFMIGAMIVIAALVIIIAGFVTSCAAGSAEASGTIASTSYLADDDDILRVEEMYCLLEQTLQSQIDQVESTNPGYDEYRYEADEIGHNPFELASYLTVRFGAYSLNTDVSKELETLFYLQYEISYSVTTEMRYRTDEETGKEEAYEYRIYTVTLKNNGLSSAISQRGLDSDEMEYYQVLMSTYGNRPDIFGDGYYNSYYVEGDSYQVPGEALTDERFARMLAEAEKYLGYPYVWGGSSPSTSFDCSGFVSWVINHCGNGWSVGRQTANGLKNLCTTIPASEAQPGDLIFFQGTYNTSGASHVGIYVGNGMMIHCGNPIKYSSINTSYWQKHFLCFGRLPAT